MPFDFFNRMVPRGAIFSAKGNKFAISNPIPPPKDFRFSSLNRRASKNFITFSDPRLFTPVRSNIITTSFRIPGKNTRASVSGFGAVFVDVNKRGKTYLNLFDRNGCLIAKIAVGPRAKGLSFAGVFVKGIRSRRNKIIRVKAAVKKVTMKLGDTPIIVKRARYNPDFVVLDDLFYGEPQAL